MPRVSVIIPAYNAVAYLGDALKSVLSQSYADWEVIVIDDGSTDGTWSLVESLKPAFDGKLIYTYQPNRGLPDARNAGIRMASGEFIAILDADDMSLDMRLERSVAVMDSNPEVGLVHARVARINTAGDIIEHPPTPSAKYLSGNIADHIYTRRAHLLCPTVMVRKRCLDVVGVFDETMRSTEDRDLWFRIAIRFPVVYIDEILAYYRISPTSMSRNTERMLKWQMFFIEKHLQTGACTKMLARQAMGNLYRERGDQLFSNGELGHSLRWYLRAACKDPLNSVNTFTVIRALGEPLLARIRRQ